MPRGPKDEKRPADGVGKFQFELIRRNPVFPPPR